MLGFHTETLHSEVQVTQLFPELGHLQRACPCIAMKFSLLITVAKQHI